MRCGYCNQIEQIGDELAPYGTMKASYIWVHPRCWPVWYVNLTAKTEEEDKMDQYPPSGRLFSNTQKRSPKSPDVNGKLEIDRNLLDHLNKCADQNKPIEMELSGWRKQSKNGKGSWYSLAAQIPWTERQNINPTPSNHPQARSVVDDLGGYPDEEIPF